MCDYEFLTQYPQRQIGNTNKKYTGKGGKLPNFPKNKKVRDFTPQKLVLLPLQLLLLGHQSQVQEHLRWLPYLTI